MYSVDKYIETKNFNDLCFHDSIISNINFDFENYILELKFKLLYSPNKSWLDCKSYNNIKLEFIDCSYFSFSNYSPWSGPPSSLSFAHNDNNLELIKHLNDMPIDGISHYCFEFISGDYLHIYCKTFKLYIDGNMLS